MMTLGKAIARMIVTIQRPDLQATFIDYLNEAVRQCALRHSFDQMKQTASVTVPMNETGATLPEDFKEFQNGRFPVKISDGTPVPVYTSSELDRLDPSFRPDPCAFFTKNNDSAQLALGTASDFEDVELTISYFAMPAEMVAGDVAEYLMAEYLPLVTHLQGGDAAALDAYVTVGIDKPKLVILSLSDDLQVWKLRTRNPGENNPVPSDPDSMKGYVFPLDRDAATNNFIWVRVQ